jgi:hypothetical protein
MISGFLDLLGRAEEEDLLPPVAKHHHLAHRMDRN